ncbi:MAG: hypothetical protein WD533_07435 [Dehalococcoidia bacterium]
MHLVIFGIILVIIAAAFAVPVLRYSDGHVDDADAVVLGAALLSMGLGAVNFVALIVHMVTEGFVPLGLLVGLAPILGGLIGLYIVTARVRDARRLLLIASAALALAGIPAYLVFTFAVFAAVATFILFLLGLSSPARVLKNIDPRN